MPQIDANLVNSSPKKINDLQAKTPKRLITNVSSQVTETEGS
jgi:transcription initiation factor TFIID subunit 1